MVYNFKKMAAVPPAEDLIDIILTRTQVREISRIDHCCTGLPMLAHTLLGCRRLFLLFSAVVLFCCKAS